MACLEQLESRFNFINYDKYSAVVGKQKSNCFNFGGVIDAPEKPRRYIGYT